MQQTDILEQLFDEKVLRILRLFYNNEQGEFYLREISKKSGIAVASTFRIMSRLLELEIVDLVQIKKFKLYKLGDNENTRFLGQFIRKQKQALEVFITRAKEISGIKIIMLQGREEKEMANVIIIGDDINKTAVKSLCGEIRDEFKFKITDLILQEEQFKQMDAMGLYPGRKKVLYHA
jgi:hypothetical protein